MQTVLTSLAPIFLLILGGYAFKRASFPGRDFWPLAERLTYYVLFPALLVDKLGSADLSGLPVAGLAASLATAVLLVSGALVAMRKAAHPFGPAFTSVFQGSIRPNTYVGLSAAWAMLGGEGVALSAVALMTLIPLVNVLCVTVLNHFGLGSTGRLRQVPGNLLRNPLILACLAGIALNASGTELPRVATDILDVLGGASLPLGLLAVGAGLRFGRLRRDARGIAASSVLKLLVLPLAAVLLGLAFGVHGPSLTVAALFTAIPASVSSFILARQLGGDHELMASIITFQTLAAAATMPLLLSLLSPLWT
ncbi:AEC family transporter [Desulfohalovibrio reitneri]|uniref:AEC family transporter n=1 Tax=Desulfohalovibrio reitneri TaxID=1307759 RepID=UPI0004A6CFF0|nr:AEC family transporter [Desulfohalovibrio reitneri]